jgi:UDP-3-O-[3-hydroxymyristoyl] glucosamine N-acyltransferase
VIVAQAGIAGSSVLEDFVAIGGQAGIAGHLKIGAGAQVAASAGVMRDIPAGEQWLGAPAAPAKEALRLHATLRKLALRRESAD